MISLLVLACAPGAPPGTEPATAETGAAGSVDSGEASSGEVPGGDSAGDGAGGTDSAAPCPAITGLTAAGGVGQLLELELSAESDRPTRAWALCTADEDPEERHLAESGERALRHRFALYGLAPERAYTCEVSSECAGAPPAAVAYTTPALPGDVGGYQVSRGDAESWGSYTLFSEIAPCQDYETTNLHAVIVDASGTVRWLYEIPEAIVSSDVDVRYLGDGLIHIAGGWGTFDTRAPHRGLFRTLDLSGAAIYERAAPTVGVGFNHHSERLESGEYLSLTYALHQDRYVGVTAEVWDPIAAAVTWSWDSEEVLLSGQVDYPGFWVANSVSFVEDELGSAMYLSMVTEDALWRVDRDSGALTHVIGYDEGWELVDGAGRPLGPGDWFFFQHDPELRDGRILMHDNGQDRPGGERTRVAEFAIDLQNRVLTLLWSWSQEGWYNPYLGDADRLDNGNILVATGYIWCAAGRADDVSSLIEIAPESGREAWRLDWPDGTYATYRAERLDGCAIFNNAATCPETAARIEALRGGAIPGG